MHWQQQGSNQHHAGSQFQDWGSDSGSTTGNRRLDYKEVGSLEKFGLPTLYPKRTSLQRLKEVGGLTSDYLTHAVWPNRPRVPSMYSIVILLLEATYNIVQLT